MGLIVAILVFCLGLFVFWKIAPKFELNPYLVCSGWIFKLICSLAFVWIFSLSGIDGKLIQGDSYNFFFDGSILNQYAKEDFFGYLKLLFGVHPDESNLLATNLAQTNIWSYGNNGDFINDNRLIIKINSLIHFFSFGNLYVHVFIFSALAYIGLLLIFKSIYTFVSNRLLFFILLITFPSVAFWGSGLTKETIAILGIGILLNAVLRLINSTFTLKSLTVLALALILLLFNKPHFGFILIPLTAILFFGKQILWRKSGLVFTTIFILCVGVILSFTPDKINIIDKISVKQRDMINLGNGGVFFVTDSSFCAFHYDYFNHFDTLPNNKIAVLEDTKGEYKLFGPNAFYPFTISKSDMLYERYLIKAPSRTYFDITPINNSGIQFLKSIPEYIFNVAVRPFPGEFSGWGSLLLFLCNIVLFALLILALIFKKKLSNFELYLVFFLAISLILLLLIIGSTTPIFGAIARYKVLADILVIILTGILLRPIKKINDD